VTHLEELQGRIAEARRAWKWDEVRRLDAAITTEKARLAQLAKDLPALDEAPRSLVEKVEKVVKDAKAKKKSKKKG
jgi:hypothetical protein